MQRDFRHEARDDWGEYKSQHGDEPHSKLTFGDFDSLHPRNSHDCSSRHWVVYF